MSKLVALLGRRRAVVAIEEAIARRIARRVRDVPLIWGPAERVEIDESALVVDAVLNTMSGTVRVGAHTFFGHGVQLLTGAHDPARRGADRQGHWPDAGRDITIGRGVWVASGAIVLGPCTIGDDAVVAAGAVVTHDVPAGAVVAGVPATIRSFVPDCTAPEVVTREDGR